MTLLEEFIFSLSKTERQKLRPLQFRGAKRKIFLKILACRDYAGIDSASIIRSNKLTRKRYNQMSAEMLAACYYDVASLGGTELLQYLGNRQLYRHFYKEMHRQEELLRSTADRKQLEAFYFKVLLMTEFFLIPPHLTGKMRSEISQFILRYTAIKTPHPCDTCYLRSTEIEEEIALNFMRDFSLDKLRASVSELEEILTCVKNYDLPLAKFKTAYVLATIYFANYIKEKKPDPYMDYIIETVKKSPAVFGSLSELIILGIKSYSAPKDDDIKHYKHFLLNPPSTGEGSSLLFIERFLPLIVIAGEHAWAKKFIAEHFPYNIDQIRKDISVHWWRLLMISKIYFGEYKEAQICLQKAFSANTGKSRNIAMDVNLRCYAVFLLAITDGPAPAREQVLQHIRYANRHGYNRGEGFMMLFLKAVYDLGSHPIFDKIPAEKVKQQYRKDLGKEERLYPLFEMVYEKYYAPNSNHKTSKTSKSTSF